MQETKSYHLKAQRRHSITDMSIFEAVYPLVFLCEFLVILLSTFLFFDGFLLIKHDTGFAGHPDHQYEPHPPLYILHEAPISFNRSNIIYSPWMSGKTELEHKTVLQSFNLWKSQLDSSCLDSRTETVEDIGRTVATFLPCRVVEVSRRSKPLLDIWGYGASSEMEYYWGSEPPMDRVILIIIDALRFDFVDATLSGQSTSYHTGQMNFLSSILRDDVDHSRLLKFVADAPTATVQRVKALISGMKII